MSLDTLRSLIPEYAGDLRRNLDAVLGDSRLSAQRLWGTVLATAIASRSAIVLRELAPEARARLSPEAYTAAKSAAAAMALSNVFFRTKAVGGPGVDRVDYELWALAVSAINACGACLDSHERVLREAGVSRETVQEAFRVASVVQAVGVTVEAEAVLSE